MPSNPANPSRRSRKAADTRSAVLDYLAEHPPATTAHLATTLNLTPADIRYHLKALRAEGLVEVVPREPGQAQARGRPAPLYRLSFATRAHNLEGLCGALLEVYLRDGEGSQAERFAALAEVLAEGESSTGSLPPGKLPLRLAQSVDWLNRRQYRASWEAGARGPRLLLRHCPYAALLADHPELCEIDRLLLERLVQQVSLRQTVRQNPLTGRPRACVFEVLQ